MTQPEGYVRGRPEVTWWDAQIKAGILFRKKFSQEGKWDLWRQYARGNWNQGTMPVNLFYAMSRSLIPRIYFRNPSISITPRKPGPTHMAFSTVLQRIDNKMIRQMKIKKQMKRAVYHAFLFGTACPKVGFGAQFTPTPDDEVTGAPIQNEEQNLKWKTEYRSNVLKNMPWVSTVHPGHLIVPDGLVDFDETRWVAHWIRRPLHEVQNDKRLKNTDDLKPTRVTSAQSGDSAGRTVELTDLFEIRDKQTQRVFIIAPSSTDKVLLFEPDEMQYEGRVPFHPIVFNEDDDAFWGIPDANILEPHQLEMNETNTQIMKHRRMSLIKFLYQTKSIKEEELDKMLSEDVMGGVQVSDINQVKPLQVAAIPQDLLIAKQNIWDDVRQEFGFSQNQGGDFNNRRGGDTTATEAEIVRQASEIRVDERRDLVADVLVDIMRDVHRVIFGNWTETEVIDVVGPQGRPIFVKFTGKMLEAGQYDIKIDPDSSLPETKAAREQKAMLLYGQFRTNPLIDPVKLTQYLLHEMQGVAFDDMMRNLGMEGGGTEDKPLEIEELGKLQGRAIQELGSKADNIESLGPGGGNDAAA